MVFIFSKIYELPYIDNHRSANGVAAVADGKKKPPMGFEPMTSRLLSGCSAN